MSSKEEEMQKALGVLPTWLVVTVKGDTERTVCVVKARSKNQALAKAKAQLLLYSTVAPHPSTIDDWIVTRVDV